MSVLRQCLASGYRITQTVCKQTIAAHSHRTCSRHEFHTSLATMEAHEKNTKRKITFKTEKKKKKSLKKQREVITIKPNMTVRQLAEATGKEVDDIFECFLYMRHNTNKYSDPEKVIKNLDVIKETVDKTGFRWILEIPKTKIDVSKDISPRPPPDPSLLVKRPPVVAIMGHIDHGKTTLLDALRKSSLVKQEFGGITQHIGAFSVPLVSGESITFLDTPGHAAFHKMRSRGAHITDIVILVVAADDGAMAQTIESIKFAKAAGVSLIVAINKIDRQEADINRTIQTLLQHGVVTEEHGGEVQAVPISALKGTNLGDLKEAIVTLSEVLDLRGDPTGSVEGTVIESRQHKNKGKLCTMLVQRGMLKKGAFLVADRVYGKVRAISDMRGTTLRTAGPGTAVEILGWKDLPSAGDFIQEVKTEKQAVEVVDYRQKVDMDQKALADQQEYETGMAEHWNQYRTYRQNDTRHRFSRYRYTYCMSTWAQDHQQATAGPALGVVIKGDVDGSVEAILDVLSTYRDDKCALNILSFGTGAVTEEDVQLAKTFSGVVLAFNTQVPSNIQATADKVGVTIATHNIIYKLVDDLKERLQDQLVPITVEEQTGEGKVLEMFVISNGKQKLHVTGCRCVEGSLNKKHRFKLLRDGQELFDGEVLSMRQRKKEVMSVNKEMECGLQLSDPNVTPQSGDQILCYELKEQPQTLSWETHF